MANENSREVRVRFAPSPTGPLHAGNVRTAIFNYLFARNAGGKFILRIEDTDAERSEEKYIKEIESSLSWLGLKWDEGPYRQSQNRKSYAAMAEELAGKGLLYPCFCSDELLEGDRKTAAKAGRPPVYTGRCAGLTEEERTERKKKEPFALRFRVEGSKLTYKDVIRGDVNVNLRLIGDFIVMRSNGEAVYNLATAHDDAEMRITHVLRGEDHMSNTPRQILLMEAMGYDKPVYAHLPLIVAEDGKKLSKRQGMTSLGELMDGGYMPEAVLNFLALIGWHSEDKKEEMDVSELIKKFSLEKVAVRPAQYDLNKLNWLNRRKIHSAKTERLIVETSKFAKTFRKDFEALSMEKKAAIVDAVKGNISLLTELEREIKPFFEYSLEPDIKKALDGYPVEDVVSALLDNCETENFPEAAEAVSKSTGAGGKALYMPLRAALSGRTHGPELKHLYAFLGREERMKRLKDFLDFYKK